MVNCQLCRHHLLPFMDFLSDPYWGREENVRSYALQVEGAMGKRVLDEQKSFKIESTLYCNACRAVFWSRKEGQKVFYDCVTKLSIAAR